MSRTGKQSSGRFFWRTPEHTCEGQAKGFGNPGLTR
jgi:hypothetical protein